MRGGNIMKFNHLAMRQKVETRRAGWRAQIQRKRQHEVKTRELDLRPQLEAAFHCIYACTTQVGRIPAFSSTSQDSVDVTRLEGCSTLYAMAPPSKALFILELLSLRARIGLPIDANQFYLVLECCARRHAIRLGSPSSKAESGRETDPQAW